MQVDSTVIKILTCSTITLSTLTQSVLTHCFHECVLTLSLWLQCLCQKYFSVLYQHLPTITMMYTSFAFALVVVLDIWHSSLIHTVSTLTCCWCKTTLTLFVKLHAWYQDILCLYILTNANTDTLLLCVLLLGPPCKQCKIHF